MDTAVLSNDKGVTEAIGWPSKKGINQLKLNAVKTELLWAGTRFSAKAQLGSKGPSVQFGAETVLVSDHVHDFFVWPLSEQARC